MTQLFSRIFHNVTHVLKPLLPTNTQHSYNLRDRRHNFALIENNSQINHRHFIIRQLYKYYYWLHVYISIFYCWVAFCPLLLNEYRIVWEQSNKEWTERGVWPCWCFARTLSARARNQDIGALLHTVHRCGLRSQSPALEPKCSSCPGKQSPRSKIWYNGLPLNNSGTESWTCAQSHTCSHFVEDFDLYLKHKKIELRNLYFSCITWSANSYIFSKTGLSGNSLPQLTPSVPCQQ